MGYANFALDMYFRKTDVLAKGQGMSVCIAWHKLKIIENLSVLLSLQRIWNGEGGYREERN